MPSFGLSSGLRVSDRLTYLDRVKQFIGSLRNRKAQTLLGGQIGLKLAAEHLLSVSNYYVPMEYGPLMKSGHVEMKAVKIGGTVVTEASIVYEAPYANYVHELPYLRHGEEYNTYYAEDIAAGRKTSRRPQEQYKFLERAIREDGKIAAGIIKLHMLKKK